MIRNNTVQLGKFIRSQRQAKGLSLRQLGKASGVDYSTISRLEQGELTSPDPVKLHKLARELDVPDEKMYELAGFPLPYSAAPSYSGLFPASSIPSVRPTAEAAEAVLTTIRQSIEKDVAGPGLQTLWRLDLAEELLSGHLTTLQTDFAKLLGGEKLSDVNTHRRDMLMSVFYGLQDTYVGVDSHLPRDYFNAYPSLLEHLRPTTEFELVNNGSHQCYAPQATRILPIARKTLQQDFMNNRSIWETYLRKHKENGIRLLQVDPSVAKQALADNVPGTGWTTDMGIWVRTCVLLFEAPGDEREVRNLQLLCPGEAAWRDYIQYAKQLIQHASVIELQGDALGFGKLEQVDKEDVLWSLDALYESPPLAQAWSRFVDPVKRLKQGEAGFLDAVIKTQKQKSGRQKLKIFDACMGVGAEVVWLRTEHAHDCEVLSNEIEWTLATQAVSFAKTRGIDLSFTMFDWRHLDTKMSELQGSFDIITILGNSLSCFADTNEMNRVLGNFFDLLAPGGVLVLDERNYRKFYDRKRWDPKDFVPPEVVYVGGVKARPKRDHMGRLGKDVMYLEYFDPRQGADQLLGYFRVYPFGDGQIKELLKSTGFGTVSQFYDFKAEQDENSWFMTYVAEKPAS